MAASEVTATENAYIAQAVRECLSSSADSEISERQLVDGIWSLFGEGSHEIQSVDKEVIEAVKDELDMRHMQEPPELLDKVVAM